jgi:hypothetical protein
MLKKLLLSVVLVFWACSSYSEGITPYHGTTGNAAGNGLRWGMGNVLPTPPGLDINGVIYRYTINKQTEDHATVNIQNEKSNGTGYIFRETDEWLPGSLDGTQINKVVPVVPSNRLLWGDGSIDVTGGSVSDPSVMYTYRVDPCYDPQFSTNCPGYKKPEITIPTIDLTTIYDVTTDTNIDINRETCKESDVSADCIILKTNSEEEESKTEEELAAEEEEEKEKSQLRLERAMTEADKNKMFAIAMDQSAILAAVNNATNMNPYYSVTMSGGVYKDSVALVDTKLPENKRGLRNGFAQQLLHEQMVGMQYKKGVNE